MIDILVSMVQENRFAPRNARQDGFSSAGIPGEEMRRDCADGYSPVSLGDLFIYCEGNSWQDLPVIIAWARDRVMDSDWKAACTPAAEDFFQIAG
jgi:hypothetical protein